MRSCHRSATIAESTEAAGIPTVIIAALPPVVRQAGLPRAAAPIVPMGANAGAPHDVEMQTAIVKSTLELLGDNRLQKDRSTALRVSRCNLVLN